VANDRDEKHSSDDMISALCSRTAWPPRFFFFSQYVFILLLASLGWVFFYFHWKRLVDSIGHRKAVLESKRGRSLPRHWESNWGLTIRTGALVAGFFSNSCGAGGGELRRVGSDDGFCRVGLELLMALPFWFPRGNQKQNQTWKWGSQPSSCGEKISCTPGQRGLE
jgi:hypothetical protein